MLLMVNAGVLLLKEVELRHECYLDAFNNDHDKNMTINALDKVCKLFTVNYATQAKDDNKSNSQQKKLWQKLCLKQTFRKKKRTN